MGKGKSRSDHMTEVCREVFVAYGIEDQLLQAIEELAELIVEINHVRRGRESSRLLKEIADVRIMLRQLELWYDHVGLVGAYTSSALDALRDRIEARRNGEEDES